MAHSVSCVNYGKAEKCQWNHRSDRHLYLYVNKADFDPLGRLLHQETRTLRRLFATGFRFATELFAKTFRGTTSRSEQRGRNSGNLPECPAGNRKMNFMIDADDAHPTHSSFPNGRYRGYTFASFFLPFLSLSLFGNSVMEEIAREKFQRVSRDVPRAEDGDLRSYKSSASAEQRSSGRDCSPIKCIRTVSGVGIRVGRRQRKLAIEIPR